MALYRMDHKDARRLSTDLEPCLPWWTRKGGRLPIDGHVKPLRLPGTGRAAEIRQLRLGRRGIRAGGPCPDRRTMGDRYGSGIHWYGNTAH